MPKSLKELKEEVNIVNRQIKVYKSEIAQLKADNEDLKRGVSAKSKKKLEELQHKVRNLEECNREYEDFINHLTGENNSLMEDSQKAQAMLDDSDLNLVRFKKKAVRIVKLLDRWLGRLPPSERENFRSSEDFEKYNKFYDRYVEKRDEGGDLNV
jgi:chromosome segregation ATPase